MCVTFSGTVSFFLVPITFIHSEAEGQRWVTPSLQRGRVREATQNITMLVVVLYGRLSGPGARLICKRTEAAAIKCSISLRCYFTEKTRLPSGFAP